MRLVHFIGQLFRFCGETVMNWMIYGLFVTSLPRLLEFLPAKSARTAQDWIAVSVGTRATFWLAVLGLIFAAFLAWKNKDDELALARRRIDPKTISLLASQVTQAGSLFDKGQRAFSREDFHYWDIECTTWLEKTHEIIKTNISEAEAILFSEPPGGVLTNVYAGNREHNQKLNALLGYQNNLRRIIERYSDR